MSLRQDHRGTLWIGTMDERREEARRRDGRIESIAGEARRPARPQRRGHHDDLRDAHRTALDRHARRRRQCARSRRRALVRQLPFGRTVPARSAPPTSPRSPRIAAATCGSAPTAADSIWRVPTARWSKCSATIPTIRGSLPVNTVYALAVDAQDRVWVGTDGGGPRRGCSDRRRPGSIRFETISRAQGLSSDTVYGVLADARGRIWLSGNAGLMRYDPRDAGGQDLSPRARPAGRGVRLRRLLPPARRPAVLRRSRRVQHLRSLAADARPASRRAWR